jgi:hypothetical protein
MITACRGRFVVGVAVNNICVVRSGAALGAYAVGP